MGLHGVSAKRLMDHLMERYRNIRASDLEAYRKALAEAIEVDQSIDAYFQRVDDSIQFNQDRKAPFNPAKSLQTAYHTFSNTGLYYLSLKE